MSTQIPLGHKIRLARLARGLNLQELGQKVNRSLVWMSHVENERIIPKAHQYEQIQAVLGFNFDTPEAEAAFAFFLGNGANETPPPH